jgi:HAD superfamily hydrolase (TIGR01509 family)
MKVTPRLEAVLFDMDGVIVDSEPLWTEAEIQFLARRSLAYAPELKAVLMGRDSREAVGILIEHYSLRESVDDVVAERNELVAGLFDTLLRPIPYALNLVKSVRNSGVKTSLVSSSPKRLIDLVLVKFSAAELFDLALSGDQVARGKPAPDIYLHAAEKLGVRPECCLVIEDAPHGVSAAKCAGMFCLAVSTSASMGELAMADKVVSGFEEVDVQLLQDLVRH